MKKRTFLAVSLLLAVSITSCSKDEPRVTEMTDVIVIEESVTKATETTETTEETTEATTESEETTESLPSEEEEEQKRASLFGENTGLYDTSDTERFGNLTDEEYAYFNDTFCPNTYNALGEDYQNDDSTPFGAECGFLASNFDGSENAYLRHVFPYPFDPDEMTEDDEPYDTLYVPVDRVNMELQQYLGLDMNGLSKNPFTIKEHEGEKCITHSTGSGAGYEFGFNLSGGFREGDDYYLCFENSTNVSIAHFTKDEEGNIRLTGCRCADNYMRHCTESLDLTNAVTEDNVVKVLSEFFEHEGRYYYVWGSDQEQADKADAFALELLKDSYYAYHGCIFEDPYVQTYFESRAWYEGTTPESSFDASVLSDIEQENVKVIESVAAS